VLSRYRSIRQEYLAMCVSADVNRSFAESKLVYDTAILFYDKAHRFFLSGPVLYLLDCTMLC